jgi:hypothetical protein
VFARVTWTCEEGNRVKEEEKQTVEIVTGVLVTVRMIVLGQSVRKVMKVLKVDVAPA